MRLYREIHDGDGPYLLLVHGMLASRAQWTLNLDALARVSRPVVVELLGHGRSPAPDAPEPYTPGGYARAFEALREELGAERWLVCGQSLGAALTLGYALDHPERVIAQVFTNSNSAFAEPGWSERARPALRAQARQLESLGIEAIEASPIHPRRSKRLPASVRDALIADCADHDPRGIAMTGLHTVPGSSVRARAAGIRVPTLMVVGRRERRFADHARFARDTIPGLQVVEADAGHAVNAEAAGAFNDAVCGFVGASLR